MVEKVYIYTDGACLGNPGPGGIGIVLKYGNKFREISEGYRNTTNNRMELMAVITALSALKMDKLDITITTDSAYVVNAVTRGWVFDWVNKNFKNKKNADLWLKFLEHYRKHHIELKWIEGHSGHLYNEKCDNLAKKAAKDPQKIDFVFEESYLSHKSLFNHE